MDMDNYFLYEDDEVSISVAGWFHRLMQEIGVKQFTLSKTDFEPILCEIFLAMQRRNAPIKNVTIAPNVPIIEYKKPICLSAPYDFFDDIVDFIAMYKNIQLDKKEIIEGVENFSNDSIKFYCDIFKNKVYNVAGYVVAHKEQEDIDIIFLFGWENNKQEEDTNEEF